MTHLSLALLQLLRLPGTLGLTSPHLSLALAHHTLSSARSCSSSFQEPSVQTKLCSEHYDKALRPSVSFLLMFHLRRACLAARNVGRVSRPCSLLAHYLLLALLALFLCGSLLRLRRPCLHDPSPQSTVQTPWFDEIELNRRNRRQGGARAFASTTRLPPKNSNFFTWAALPALLIPTL